MLLGVTLGAMGGVIGMTKEAMTPIFEGSAQIGQSVGGAALERWDCTCGQKGITSNFCPNCGAKKPQPVLGWICPQCGLKGIDSNFCPNCGTKRPALTAWDCSCGQKGIISNFCPNCGSKRPENQTWTCSKCGTSGISGNFCPNCGQKQGG